MRRAPATRRCAARYHAHSTAPDERHVQHSVLCLAAWQRSPARVHAAGTLLRVHIRDFVHHASDFFVYKMVNKNIVLVHFSVLVLSDECDESDELLVTVISIQCCVCTRL